jgi:hypothetical protein
MNSVIFLNNCCFGSDHICTSSIRLIQYYWRWAIFWRKAILWKTNSFIVKILSRYFQQSASLPFHPDYGKNNSSTSFVIIRDQVKPRY